MLTSSVIKRNARDLNLFEKYHISKNSLKLKPYIFQIDF